MDILDCDNLNICFKKSKDIIKTIETANTKKDPLKTYSTNSKRAFYQTILKLKDIIPLKLTDKATKEYISMFEEHGTASHLDTQNKIENDVIMTFNDYLTKVKDHYGEISKEYLISSLYHLSGFRDDLILKIVDEPTQTDKTMNYIIIPQNKNKNLFIELNSYKTGDKYGYQIIKINKQLSGQIRKYMNESQLNYNDFLFGNKSLSSFIKKFNNKMSLNITINKLRQMRVSDILNNKPTIKERVKLSHEMNHKPTTSEKYQRKQYNIIYV
jgi:hypothetical protein